MGCLVMTSSLSLWNCLGWGRDDIVV
jgi:hypothetical protein